MAGGSPTLNGRPVLGLKRLGTPLTAETTVTASVVNTTETVLATFCTLPANFFTSTKGLIGRAAMRSTGSGTGGPTMNFRIRANGVAGDILAATGALAIPSGALTNAQLWLEFWIQGVTSTTVWTTGQLISPTGASLGVADICHPLGNGTLGTATSAAVTLSSVAAQDLVLTVEFSSNTAGNSVSAGPGCYVIEV